MRSQRSIDITNTKVEGHAVKELLGAIRFSQEVVETGGHNLFALGGKRCNDVPEWFVTELRRLNRILDGRRINRTFQTDQLPTVAQPPEVDFDGLVP